MENEGGQLIMCGIIPTVRKTHVPRNQHTGHGTVCSIVGAVDAAPQVSFVQKFPCCTETIPTHFLPCRQGKPPFDVPPASDYNAKPISPQAHTKVE